ncbi:MAG TPA: hypothetical protein VGD11_05460 [Mycobacteriales bacterium]
MTEHHTPPQAGADRRPRRRGPRFAATLGVALAATLATTLLTAVQADARAVQPAKARTQAAVAAESTRFGAAIWPVNGESYQAALARADKTYGRLDTTRVFYGGLPAAWPGTAGISGRHVVVSFKALPRDVLAGRHDTALRTWFATAPKNRDVDWIYFHEPENDIERGVFSAADYRAAFRRIAGLADQARNPRLRATVNLMCWTYNKNSKRSWKNYYPGSDVVDVMAYDCYNESAKVNRYAAPAEVYGAAIANARALGKPFGIAETGSLVVKGDTGAKGRAAWLDAAATYLRGQKARYVTYFDCTVGGEFRLLDKGSQAVWKKHVTAA